MTQTSKIESAIASLKALGSVADAAIKELEAVLASNIDTYFHKGVAVKPLPNGTKYFSLIINKNPPQIKVWGAEPDKDAMRLAYGRVFKTAGAAVFADFTLKEAQIKRSVAAGVITPDAAKDLIEELALSADKLTASFK